MKTTFNRKPGQTVGLLAIATAALIFWPGGGALAADGKIDVSKLKPGDQLEYQDWQGWVTVEYVGPDRFPSHVLIRKAKSKQPESTPLVWLRMPANAKPLGNPSAVENLNNPFATEEERAAANKPRTWNDHSGKFKIDASLVKIDDGKVVLRRTDGQELTVALDNLSDADQKYVGYVPKPLATASTDQKNDNAAAADKSATGEKPSDEKPKGDESLPITPTDLNAARIIDFDESAAWSYQPDPTPKGEKLHAARIGLASTDVFETPTRILLLPKEKRAFVIYVNSTWGADRHEISRVQACNVESGRQEVSAIFGQDTVPIDISPDGTLVLAQKTSGWGWGKSSELQLYERQGNRVKPLEAWRPYEVAGGNEKDSQRQLDTDVKWARFLDSEHVLTLNDSWTSGALVLWEVPSLRPVYAIQLKRWSSLPGFSAGQKYLALGTEKGVTILNAADGQFAGTIPAEAAASGLVAFSDDGRRLALCTGERFRVWDLTNRNLTHDFAVQGLSGSVTGPLLPGMSNDPLAVRAAARAGFVTQMTWSGNQYLVLNGRSAVDVDRRVAIWHRNAFDECSQVRDGCLCALTSGLTAGSKALAIAPVPPKTAVDAVANLKPDDLLVLRPGIDVAIDLQINGAQSEDLESARQAIETRLQKNGMRVSSDSKIRLVGTIEQESKTVKYIFHNRFQPFAKGEESDHQVPVIKLTLSFRSGEEVLWKYESGSNAPTSIVLHEGETADQVIQREMEKRNEVFDAKSFSRIWVPAYLARLPVAPVEN